MFEEEEINHTCHAYPVEWALSASLMISPSYGPNLLLLGINLFDHTPKPAFGIIDSLTESPSGNVSVALVSPLLVVYRIELVYCNSKTF